MVDGDDTVICNVGSIMDDKKNDVIRNGEEKLEKKISDTTSAASVVFIQDTSFSVKIIAPNVEPFNVQVSSMELVQEIHQLLMDREDTCHRTCFSLQLMSSSTNVAVVLDNFTELKSIEGLNDGSVLYVVEEPYTVREARIHLRHIRDLLKPVDDSDAYNGLDCASLSFLSTICQGDVMEHKKRFRTHDATSMVDCTPPDYILPESSQRPMLPLLPQANNRGGGSCLKVLAASAWNPPPGHRKMQGDLMYVFVVTMEDKRFHITASTRGFFVNKSTENDFNPLADSASVNSSHHSLVELLSQISPSFKKNFMNLQKKRTQRHPFERVATPYQLNTWMSPLVAHTSDSIRAEDTFSSKLGYEEHIPGQTRDWNEELQTTRELPRSNLPERILRERAIFKVHSDFVSAATRGAVAVIDGHVMPINPGEETKMQMFIWNSIFFSLGFDVRDHYKLLGGDAAAHVAPRNDLQGVKVYNTVDLEGLFTLGTVVIDYRGYRVTAQSIIPGILERDQDQSVVYGSIDFGKTVVTHLKYMDLLQKAGVQLKIIPHTVINDKNEEINLCSSVECKGIIGNDGRHYILDLLRTFPADVNFLELEPNVLELSAALTKLGLPIVHKHKLACLRQELIDAFVEAKYLMFIKIAALHLQQLGKMEGSVVKKQLLKTGAVVNDQQIVEATQLSSGNIPEKSSNLFQKKEDGESEDVEGDLKEDKKCLTDTNSLDESTKDIIRKATKVVGSLKDTEFDIRFNPDVFSPGVKHHNPDSEAHQRQCALVKDAAEFLVLVQIPSFIRDCLDHTYVPLDGSTMCENLHHKGINIRYLGIVANIIAGDEETAGRLRHVLYFLISEIIARSIKHIYTTYIQAHIDMSCLTLAISHFLNCLFASCCAPASNLAASSKTNKRHKKQAATKFPSAARGGGSAKDEWVNLTPKLLWLQIRQQAQEYFNFDIKYENVDEVMSQFRLQKISLLRLFCMNNGIQLLMKEYNLEAKYQPIFYHDDILNVFPRVKHISPRASDAYAFYTTGQSKIKQGFLKDGYELICESLNLLNNVYGAMHPELCQCIRMLARLNYIMGDHVEAMSYQQRAVLMSERVNGPEHPYTITEYTHLALYCFANGLVSISLKLLYRSRYLFLLIAGEIHPEVALVDANIGLILHAVGEFDLSLKFLDQSLKTNQEFHGTKSLNAAVSHHLVARTQSCMGDFRSALQHEKTTFNIYKDLLGAKHSKTVESSDCLRHLTQQAVVLQKKMNEIYTTGKSCNGMPPIQIQPPSMGNVLDMLNVVNGILFVHITPTQEVATESSS